jgi:hypothetical protein
VEATLDLGICAAITKGQKQQSHKSNKVNGNRFEELNAIATTIHGFGNKQLHS